MMPLFPVQKTKIMAGSVIVWCLLAGSSRVSASEILLGSAEASVQLVAPSGSVIGPFGPPGATSAATDSAGRVFTVIPGNSSSTIDIFDANQNLLGSVVFTAPPQNGSFPSFVVDAAWGGADTLWLSTFDGFVYHFGLSGQLLSSFNTGTSEPGVAVGGGFVYTSSGPGFFNAQPLIYRRDLSGNVLSTIDTGLNDTLGLGYDNADGSFWVGGFDTLTHVSAAGAILATLSELGTNTGVEVGDVAAVSDVPEPSTLVLLAVGLALVFWRRRKAALGKAALALAAAGSLGAAVTLSTVTASPVAPQPVGTEVTFTATASDSSTGALRYRFRIGPPGGSLAMVRDFGPVNTLSWAPDQEGSYQIEVTAKNETTGSTSVLTQTYGASSRVNGSLPVVSPTAHPLVALYSAPPCASGSIRVRFKRVADSYWQTTPLKPCGGGASVNFYVAGMRASTDYQMRQDVIDPPRILSGPVLPFTTGAIAATLPATAVVTPLPPSEVLTQGVTLVATLESYNANLRAYAVDAFGNVIWYNPLSSTYLTRAVPGGTFLQIYGFTRDLPNSGLRETDLVGNIVKETNVERLNDQLAVMGVHSVTTIHHEVRRLQNGNYLALAMTERLSDIQGPNLDIAGDVILVLDHDLQILWAWDSFDHLDITRKAVLGETCGLAAGLCVLFNATDANDWTHGNALALTPDGNILYSARSQDLVYKIDYATTGDGHVIWKLGKDGDFQWLSSDPYPWFSHQHDPDFETPSLITVYDNGNTRVSTFAPGNSRGQALQIDEANRTITPVLNADLGIYSFALGSAQRLNDGNYVFESGFAGITGQTPTVAPDGSIISMITEQTPVYRDFRMRDLYTSPW